MKKSVISSAFFLTLFLMQGASQSAMAAAVSEDELKAQRLAGAGFPEIPEDQYPQLSSAVDKIKNLYQYALALINRAKYQAKQPDDITQAAQNLGQAAAESNALLTRYPVLVSHKPFQIVYEDIKSIEMQFRKRVGETFSTAKSVSESKENFSIISDAFLIVPAFLEHFNAALAKVSSVVPEEPPQAAYQVEAMPAAPGGPTAAIPEAEPDWDNMDGFEYFALKSRHNP